MYVVLKRQRNLPRVVSLLPTYSFEHVMYIEMIDLPKYKDSIPAFLRHRKPPIVSYSYTKTISSWIFNQKSVVEELDFDVGTEDIRVVIVLRVHIVMSLRDKLLLATLP